jgi:hypothetical protein
MGLPVTDIIDILKNNNIILDEGLSLIINKKLYLTYQFFLQVLTKRVMKINRKDKKSAEENRLKRMIKQKLLINLILKDNKVSFFNFQTINNFPHIKPIRNLNAVIVGKNLTINQI